LSIVSVWSISVWLCPLGGSLAPRPGRAHHSITFRSDAGSAALRLTCCALAGLALLTAGGGSSAIKTSTSCRVAMALPPQGFLRAPALRAILAQRAAGVSRLMIEAGSAGARILTVS